MASLTYEFIFRNASTSDSPVATGPGGSPGRVPAAGEAPKIPEPSRPAASQEVTPQQVQAAVERAAEGARRAEKPDVPAQQPPPSQAPGGMPAAPRGSEKERTDKPAVPDIQRPAEPQGRAGDPTLDKVEAALRRASDEADRRQPQAPDMREQAKPEADAKIPQQRASESKEQPSTPPSQRPPEPRQPAGEATLDAIREAASRSARQADERQPPVSVNQSQRHGDQPAEPPQIPRAPQPQAGTVTPQAVQQVIVQAGEPGRRPLPEHPDLPSLKQPEIPETPTAQHQPPTSPRPSPELQMQQNIQRLLSGLGSAGVPGVGSLAGLAGAATPVAAATIGVGSAIKAFQQGMKQLESAGDFSPEVMAARSEAEILEQMRLMEQARLYGETDAAWEERKEQLKRGERAFQDSTVRSLRGDNGILFMNPILAGLRAIKESIDELRRDLGSSQSPISKYIESFDHVPDPPGFTGQTVFESSQPSPVVGL